MRRILGLGVILLATLQASAAKDGTALLIGIGAFIAIWGTKK